MDEEDAMPKEIMVQDESIAVSMVSEQPWVQYSSPHRDFNGRVEQTKNKRAVWWKVFHVFKDADKEYDSHIACCNICGAVITTGANHSPTPLKQHLFASHKKVFQTLNALRLGETSFASLSVDPTQPGMGAYALAANSQSRLSRRLSLPHQCT